MINPINNNTDSGGNSRAVDRTIPSEAAKVSTNRSALNVSNIQPQQDSVEVSAFGQSFEAYSKALGQSVDVRPDVVGNAREAIKSPVNYPPLDVVGGIVKLIGNELAGILKTKN